jgi:hypothetical protein
LGDETQLGPGDGFIWTLSLGGEVRNDGTEPVVVATVDICPETEGTPEAGKTVVTPTPKPTQPDTI